MTLPTSTPTGRVTPDHLVARVFTAPRGAALPYRLYVPRDYVQTRRYPLVVVLHGAGQRGSDNEQQLGQGVLAFCDGAMQKRTPTFVIYPQCALDARWVETPWALGRYDQTAVPISQPLGAVVDLVQTLFDEFTLDATRLLVAGLSMGGYGTWDLITRFPERFAGALPICGGGDPTQAARAKSVPVWAFHGATDDVVPVSGSRLMVAALRKAGGRVKYKEFPRMGHHIWQTVFDDRAVLSWLLAQQRKRA